MPLSEAYLDHPVINCNLHSPTPVSFYPPFLHFLLHLSPSKIPYNLLIYYINKYNSLLTTSVPLLEYKIHIQLLVSVGSLKTPQATQTNLGHQSRLFPLQSSIRDPWRPSLQPHLNPTFSSVQSGFPHSSKVLISRGVPNIFSVCKLQSHSLFPGVP